MNAKLDLTKPVRTRDGRPARIICTDAKIRKFPITALVDNGSGDEWPMNYTLNGEYIGPDQPSPLDLVNI